MSAAREIFIEKDSEDSIDISLGIQDNRQNMINLSRAVCEDVDFIDDILPCPFCNILKNEKILRQQVENSVCCYRSWYIIFTKVLMMLQVSLTIQCTIESGFLLSYTNIVFVLQSLNFYILIIILNKSSNSLNNVLS